MPEKSMRMTVNNIELVGRLVVDPRARIFAVVSAHAADGTVGVYCCDTHQRLAFLEEDATATVCAVYMLCGSVLLPVLGAGA